MLRCVRATGWAVFVGMQMVVWNPSPARAAVGDEYWDGEFGTNGPDGDVYAVASDGPRLYIGGFFNDVGGVAATNIAMWDGTGWSALGQGFPNGGGDPFVGPLHLSGTNLYVAGTFSMAGDVAARNVARWDGSNWFALGSGVGGTEGDFGGWFVGSYSIASSGTHVYVGGWFTNAGAVAVRNIARWDGANWSALGTGIQSPVEVLLFTNGYLYAGGTFTNAGGVAASRLARWNGSTWSAVGGGVTGGFEGAVWALASKGNDLYVGGRFTHAGGVAANNIARWNGTTWSALGSGVQDEDAGTVSVLNMAMGATNLYVVGSFTNAGGVGAANVARWNGGTWAGLGSGLDSRGDAATLADDGLYAGGSFSTAGGKSSPYLARWFPAPFVVALGQDGTDVDIEFTSLTNMVYGVGYSETLDPASWSNALAGVTGTNGSRRVQVPMEPNRKKCFYKVTTTY